MYILALSASGHNVLPFPLNICTDTFLTGGLSRTVQRCANSHLVYLLLDQHGRWISKVVSVLRGVWGLRRSRGGLIPLFLTSNPSVGVMGEAPAEKLIHHFSVSAITRFWVWWCCCTFVSMRPILLHNLPPRLGATRF